MFLTRAALVLALCAFAYALCVNLYVITLPGPQEYRESAMIVATDALARGQNLYSIQNQPQLTNMYGIGYHALMAPIVRIAGGSTLLAHRVVSTLLTLASCFLIVAALRRQKLQWSLAIVAGVLLYLDLAIRGADLGQRALPETILARPDALGLLLFLLSVLLPLRFDFSNKSLIASIALAVLALLTKPYFIFGYGVVGAYLVLIGRRKRGLIYLLAGGASFALAIIAATWLMPTYAANVITGTAAASAQGSFSHLFAQLRTYLMELPGVILIVIMSACAMRRRPLALPTFAAACAFVILVVKLGRYHGNSMIYFAHLLTPFLLLSAFGAIAITPPARRWGWLLLVLLDLLLLPLTAQRPPRAHADVWARWEQLLATKKNVYAPPPLDWILVAQHKPIYDGGLSDSFLHSMERPIYPPERVLRERYAAFLADLRAQVEQQRFDLIVLPYENGGPSLCFVPTTAVERFYRPIGQLDLPMDWQPGWCGVVFEPTKPLGP